MAFTPFHLEQWQSEYEQTVKYNLADSGVQPVSLREILEDDAAHKRLMDLPVHYPPVNGTPGLRRAIAALYGANADNVLVTVGASEANAITLHALLKPGDHITVMEPGYRQLWGMAHNLGCVVNAYNLRADQGWRLDLDELEASVTPSTKLIGVTNPNNPTGKILTSAEMDRIVAVAAKHGCWILADEVYRGSERLTDVETPSFFGRYDRLVLVNSTSKAYGLSGLRIGWVVAPAQAIDDIWRRHEYAVISAGALDMLVAELALTDPNRTSLIARTRKFIREGYSRLDSWVKENSSLLSIVPPQSTALAFVNYKLDIDSVTVGHAIREAGVLVAPGKYFGVEHHLRITHGLNAEYLGQALSIVSSVLQQIQSGQRKSAGRAPETVAG